MQQVTLAHIRGKLLLYALKRDSLPSQEEVEELINLSLEPDKHQIEYTCHRLVYDHVQQVARNVSTSAEADEKTELLAGVVLMAAQELRANRLSDEGLSVQFLASVEQPNGGCPSLMLVAIIADDSKQAAEELPKIVVSPPAKSVKQTARWKLW